MTERKKPKPREKLNIIYDTTFRDRRLVIATDPNNWIIVRGSPELEEDVFLHRGDKWFFVSLPNMLMALQRYFIKERIKRLETSEMIRVIEQSYEDVQRIGRELVLEIVHNDAYGTLPRFPCDHILGIASSKKQPQKA